MVLLLMWSCWWIDPHALWSLLCSALTGSHLVVDTSLPPGAAAMNVKVSHCVLSLSLSLSLTSLLTGGGTNLHFVHDFFAHAPYMLSIPLSLSLSLSLSICRPTSASLWWLVSTHWPTCSRK